MPRGQAPSVGIKVHTETQKWLREDKLEDNVMSQCEGKMMNQKF